MFKGLLGKKEDTSGSEVDYIELEGSAAEQPGHMLIKIATLREFTDTEAIQNELRKGHIIWTKIKPLRDKDMTELKRAVDRLRKTCIAVNGDIAGVDEDYLVLTPAGVRVHRG